MGKGVLFIGSIMVDIIAPVDRLPLSGQGVVAEGVSTRLGGCAFNSANMARQLAATAASAPQVRLFAPVGEGPYGSFVEKELVKRGMDVFKVEDSATDSGAAVCLIEPDGERTMLTLPGIERQFTPQWFAQLEKSLPEGDFGSGNLCGYEAGGVGGDAMIAFFEAHPEIQLWFAPGPMVATISAEKLARINALSPIWHLNEAEALSVTGAPTIEAAGEVLLTWCKQAAVITAGADGCYVFEVGEAVRHIPTQAVRPVDTIGAGDAHLGALMVARAVGKTWEEACAMANKASGTVCGVEGAILNDEAFTATGMRL